jgi:hypothetical protein
MEYDLERACQHHWRGAGLDQFEPPVIREIEPTLSRLELYIRDVPAIRHIHFRRFCSEMLRFPECKQIRSILLEDFHLGGEAIEVTEPSTEDLKDIADLLWPYWQGGDFHVFERGTGTERITFYFYGLSIIQGEGWDKLMIFLQGRFKFSAWIIIDLDTVALEKMY